ncbi:hypothetical protein BDW69DRAFT_189523 [Aspergillus filifer]
MAKRPQFFDNNLKVADIDEPSLRQWLDDLQNAVAKGVNIIETGNPPTGEYDGRGIFTGELGVAVAYFRLAQQATALSQKGKDLPDLQALASARTLAAGPDIPLRIGALSPLPSKSPIAAIALRMLHRSSKGNATSSFETDVACLNDAVDLALSHGPTAHYHGHDLGADEVLFGRAGLLWTLLNIRTRVSHFEPVQQQRLQSVLGRIPELAITILDAGRRGAAEYVREYGGDGALPLMWPWHPGHHGTGWAHGLTGIIPVLLACRPEELTRESHNYLHDIGGTVTALCKLCIAQGGHLPTTIPPKLSSSKREQPLVQICHGAPALLALLGVVLKNTNLVLNHWTPEWDSALRLATDRVWEEGLLSKGGGLCHGIAGNAWPFLMLHDAMEYNASTIKTARDKHSASRTECPSADEFLGKALTMLLHARDTKPYNTFGSGPCDYRLPDHPLSLFEGLAGTVCAWAEACVIILAKLRKMELGESYAEDETFREYKEKILGFPCLGGNGAMGVL